MTAITVAASLAKTLYSYLDDDGRLLIPATSQEHADEIVARIREARRLARDPSQMWPRTPGGTIDVEAALPALARRFPSLCTGIPGIEPWNPTALLRWLVLGGDSYAAALAAKFVLTAADLTQFAKLIAQVLTRADGYRPTILGPAQADAFDAAMLEAGRSVRAWRGSAAHAADTTASQCRSTEP